MGCGTPPKSTKITQEPSQRILPSRNLIFPRPIELELEVNLPIIEVFDGQVYNLFVKKGVENFKNFDSDDVVVLLIYRQQLINLEQYQQVGFIIFDIDDLENNEILNDVKVARSIFNFKTLWVCKFQFQVTEFQLNEFLIAISECDCRIRQVNYFAQNLTSFLKRYNLNENISLFQKYCFPFQLFSSSDIISKAIDNFDIYIQSFNQLKETNKKIFVDNLKARNILFVFEMDDNYIKEELIAMNYKVEIIDLKQKNDQQQYLLNIEQVRNKFIPYVQQLYKFQSNIIFVYDSKFSNKLMREALELYLIEKLRIVAEDAKTYLDERKMGITNLSNSSLLFLKNQTRTDTQLHQTDTIQKIDTEMQNDDDMPLFKELKKIIGTKTPIQLKKKKKISKGPPILKPQLEKPKLFEEVIQFEELMPLEELPPISAQQSMNFEEKSKTNEKDQLENLQYQTMYNTQFIETQRKTDQQKPFIDPTISLEQTKRSLDKQITKQQLMEKKMTMGDQFDSQFEQLFDDFDFPSFVQSKDRSEEIKDLYQSLFRNQDEQVVEKVHTSLIELLKQIENQENTEPLDGRQLYSDILQYQEGPELLKICGFILNCHNEQQYQNLLEVEMIDSIQNDLKLAFSNYK